MLSEKTIVYEKKLDREYAGSARRIAILTQEKNGFALFVYDKDAALTTQSYADRLAFVAWYWYRDAAVEAAVNYSIATTEAEK